MKRILSSRFIAAAALAAATLGAASAAQARPDVQVSIGLPGLPGLPVFVQPRPFYGPPPVVSYERAWRHAEWQRRESERSELERREWQHRHHDRYPSYGHGRG